MLALRSGAGRTASLGVGLAVVLAIALRLPTLAAPSFPDEAGYLLVAQRWHDDGPRLYGHLFVDRPPLLLLFWRAAAALGGIESARWLALGLVVGLVSAAGCGGWLLGGRRGALWSAFTAAALASTPALGAYEVDGELLAAPLVLTGCVLVLKAVRAHTGRRFWWAVAAGVVAASAVLVKQNFVDALVFGVVLTVASGLRGQLARGDVLRVLAGLAAGVAGPVLAVLDWAATTSVGVDGLLFSMYGFRSSAAEVLASQSMTAPLIRLRLMLGLGLISGLLVVTLATLWWQRHRLAAREPETLALVAMLATGVAGVVLGGSFWLHYLLGLVPVLALAMGACATTVSRRGNLLVAAVVASAVLATTATTAPASVAAAVPAAAPVVDSFTSNRDVDGALVAVLGRAARPDDTMFVTYGHANLVQRSGLEPAYPFLWSLPMRTLDPRLRLLVRRLSGPHAPTWLIEREEFNSWGIDSAGRLAAAVERHYRLVATVCGAPVYLHQGLRRNLPRDLAAC